MAEKPPTFTVTDRRKFTIEGELRDDNTAAQRPEEADREKPVESSARIITMPSPKQEEASTVEPITETAPAQEAAPDELLAGPSAQESAEQHAAYQESSRHIDAMLRQADPGMEAGQNATFEHVVQSIYLSSVMAMGAGTEEGQKPRIDIIGARQSIDMLAVLQEKTKGNLTEKEQRLLQNALFDLRMMFVELTNAIAQSAQRPPEGKK
jgi:Domain of unknown function (DUF1844)